MAKALTIRAIDSLKPGPARREVPDGGMPGLYLILQPSGVKSWAIRYRTTAGVPRKLTLKGKYPATGLATARGEARKALAEVASGNDPAADKIAARHAPKVVHPDMMEKVASTFLARHADPNTRASSAKEYKRVLDKEVLSRWAGRRLSSIRRAEVHEMLDEIVDRGAPVQANRTLAAFRKLCGWALDRGIVDTSPCHGIKPPTVESSRDRVLSDDELRAIWRAADAIGYPVGPIVKLLMLTGQRRTEVAHMTWAEVDVAATLWTIPAARAKNGNQHAVPLSAQALVVLNDLPRIGDRAGLAFTTNGRSPVSGFGQFKTALDRRITADRGDALPHWTFHDLRRTCATGMARHGIALPTIERALNHVSGSFRGIVATYQHHNYAAERRHALDAWAAFVERLVTAEPGGNVVEMRAATAV